MATKETKTMLDLYRSILSSVGMIADSQGFISTLLPGSDTPKPFSVESKRLVLPTEDQLKQTDWSNRIGFHPLLQNLTGGESRVMEKFRDRMNGYSDFMLGMTFIELAQLAVRDELHKELTPKQASYLGPFSDADEKFVKLLTDLVKYKRTGKKNFEFIRYSVIKGRVWNGQKRSRVAVTHFPLYESLPTDNKPTTILGYKLRIADVKMIRAMYEFLFTNIKTPAEYEVGSDSKIAPSVESLMTAYAMFVDVNNTVIGDLSNAIATGTERLINNDWREGFKDLSKYLSEIRHIPLLEGNTASERIVASSTPQRITDNPHQVTKPQVVQQEPVAQPAIINNPVKPQEQQVQQPQQTGMRFRLGTPPPVVESGTTHQVPLDAHLQQAPRHASQPTPPVGAMINQPVHHQPPQQMHQQMHQQAHQQQSPSTQATDIPGSARMVGDRVYIPVEGSGVGNIPPNALMIDGRTYIPYGTAPQQQHQPMMQPQPTYGMYQQQQTYGAQQQSIPDPGQIPGLSAEEVNMYRNNPVMYQMFLKNTQANMAQAYQANIQTRQQAVPSYLQRAMDQANQQQQQQQFYQSNPGGYPYQR